MQRVVESFELPEHGPVQNLELKIFDASLLKSFQRCPRAFKHRQLEEFRAGGADGFSSSLVFGAAVHRGLATLFQTRSVELAVEAAFEEPHIHQVRDEKRSAEMLEPLFREYWKRWRSDFEGGGFRVLEDSDGKPIVEYGFVLPLPKEGYFYGGRIDMLVEYQKQIFVVDHKTSSGLHYVVNSARPNVQFDGYAWAAEQLFGECAGILLDVLVLKKRGLEFSRFPTPRSEFEFRRFEKDVLATVKLLEFCLAGDLWPCHTDRCFDYFRPCLFHNLCVFDSDLGLERRRDEQEHVD